MKIKKMFFGLLSLLVGYFLFVLIIDIISKPSNIGISIKPIESLGIYFFGFSWTMGNIGLFLGSILLISYLIVFYLLGTWIYKKSNNK
ncbi:hypothetical protein [Tenacibaculum piscium]|uniref:hypothetical protein n=1 Tax=Tenacibaculum piscium TaxID=1458515 RepID=UPI000C7A4C44|nr:hypothetical protein [Tenacibaculum piscium]